MVSTMFSRNSPTELLVRRIFSSENTCFISSPISFALVRISRAPPFTVLSMLDTLTRSPRISSFHWRFRFRHDDPQNYVQEYSGATKEECGYEQQADPEWVDIKVGTKAGAYTTQLTVFTIAEKSAGPFSPGFSSLIGSSAVSKSSGLPICSMT